MNNKNKEKLPLYVEQLIRKGNNIIKELSEFDDKISMIHADKIKDFQFQEINKISGCRTAMILIFHISEEKDIIKSLNEKLDDYQNNVQYFAYNFPVDV